MADTAHLLSQFYVKIDGQNASEEFMHDLTEVRVESSLHLPDVATLVLHDARLHWVDYAGLTPGKTVTDRGEVRPEGRAGLRWRDRRTRTGI